jgi:hypothetical protein
MFGDSQALIVMHPEIKQIKAIAAVQVFLVLRDSLCFNLVQFIATHPRPP